MAKKSTDSNTVKKRKDKIVEKELQKNIKEQEDSDNEIITDNNKDEIRDPFQEIDKLINQMNNEDTNRKQSIQQGKIYRFFQNRWVKLIRKIVEAVVWVSLSVYVAIKTEFKDVILYSDQVNRLWFNIGLFGLFGFSLLFLYSCYLFYFVSGDPKDWDKTYPQVVPIATVFLCIFSIGSIVGCWPVWGFYTPFILVLYLTGVAGIIELVSWGDLAKNFDEQKQEQQEQQQHQKQQ